MFLKRFPVVAMALLLTVALLGVVLSHIISTSASNITVPPPTAALNHPSVIYTDGAPAVPAHTDGTILTVSDIQKYVTTHPFPAGPVVAGAQLKIQTLQLMTSKEASVQMRGESIGLPDNAMVYYVIVQGPFLWTRILTAANPQGGTPTFTLGEEAFDAQTGNLLVWGIRG